ncbi:MAG: patatin-like phospholipase family protein [Candidatus Margulisiibacteriota bacterium]
MKTNTAIIDAFRKVPMFATLSQAELKQLADKVHIREIPPGTSLCREGDTSEAFFIIIEGHVQVSLTNSKNEEKVLAILKQGDYFGEMALLTGEPRSANVKSSTSCIIGTLYKDDFARVLNACPEIGVNLCKTLAIRLSKTNRIIKEESRASIVSIISNEIDPGFMETIANDLSAHGKTIAIVKLPAHIDDIFIRSLERSQDTDIQLLNLPAVLSAEHKKILTISDKVISFGSRPDSLKGVFTLPDGDKTRFKSSVVRKILGKSVGLALSSGTAQGLTHLGVLRVLHREGIPIDMIAGTSGGALYGAPFAMGISRQKHEQILINAYRKGVSKLADYSFPPFRGLIKGKRVLNRALWGMIGSETFDAVHIPFLAISTDITLGQETIHWQGQIKPAIRASMSIPAIITPVFLNKNVLVDGAVTTPVPVEPLFDFGVDKVIAVFVSEVGQFTYKKPNILDTFMRARSVSIDRIAMHNLARADLVIKPDTSDIGCFEYEKVETLIELGAQAAEKLLPAIRAIAT